MSVLDGGLEVIIVEMISVWDSSLLVQSEDRSGIWGRSFPPGVSGLLSIDSSVSCGLGGVMSVLDGGLEVIIVEMISVWDGSLLVQSEDRSGIWGRSLSPGVSGLLSIDGSVSSSLGGIMSVLDGGLEVIIVEMISIWNSSSLVQSEDRSCIWGRSLSPGVSGFLSINGRLSG